MFISAKGRVTLAGVPLLEGVEARHIYPWIALNQVWCRTLGLESWAKLCCDGHPHQDRAAEMCNSKSFVCQSV